MLERNGQPSSGSRLRDVAAAGARATGASTRPLRRAVGGAAALAADAGISLERRAVDRLLESDELERLLLAVISSDRIRRALQSALESDTATKLADDFFDSGLFDHIVDRLLGSDALWRLVDEIAQSPSVTAAISGQGLGFADQLGGELRTRSRRADNWLERTAGRVAHRSRTTPETEPESR